MPSAVFDDDPPVTGADLWIEDPTNAWGVTPEWSQPSPSRGAAAVHPRGPEVAAAGIEGAGIGSGLNAGVGAAPRPAEAPTTPKVHDTQATAVLDLRVLRRTPKRRTIVTEAPSVEAPYPPVLGFTAIWYAVPGVLYLVWLTTLEASRQSHEWRALIANMPWLLAAVAGSLVVSVLLRRVVYGWRALTISFAAAVIGSGLTTMVHTLSA